jgi:hypothetical protein
LAKFHILLLIHAHQPVGNFDDVLERAYAQSYRPFVELLLRHPAVRIGLHYSGPLLEWIEQHRPQYFELLRELVGRGQVELIGGGFYEPILISIPPADRLEQLRRLADYLEKNFGRRPEGAWLTERVWEPQLPTTFAQAGVGYTLTDDIHFLSGGLDAGQLHGYYLAEDLGSTVKVIPGLKALRYLIPYRSVEESLDFIRAAAQQHPGGLAAMGDDLEKFGVWPGTYEHCYTNGWLERFFAALQASADWLAVTPPGEYLAAHPPLGRADLPGASYTEMMGWALPTPARERFNALEKEFSNRPELAGFFRGGMWRSFLTKYPEVNLLHKKMLHVSEKLERLGRSRRRGAAFRRSLAEAATHLLRAQCNDAYWHGIFGGLYAPHLRTALWRELVRAEKLAGAAEHGRGAYAELERGDYDADGQEELCLSTDRFAALLKPADGGTIAALDFRPAAVTLINSLQRRLEPYHARLKGASAQGGGGFGSIHEQARVKEPGLAERLRYDRWARHSFRLLLFASGKGYNDYAALRLDENPAFAGGPYRVGEASSGQIELLSEPATLPCAGGQADGGAWCSRKSLAFRPVPEGFEIECAVVLTHPYPVTIRLQAGIEVILNFMAPDARDRYFETAGVRHPLNWGGTLPASSLRVADEWQKVAATIAAPAAREFWVAPIETVSESEEGFERVYQGSQILAVWPVELTAAEQWTARLVLRVSHVR